MICSYCNSYNNDNYKFCQYCGKTLVFQNEQPQPETLPPQTIQTSKQTPQTSPLVQATIQPSYTQIPPQNNPIPDSGAQSFQTGQGMPDRPILSPYHPPQQVPLQGQSYHYPKKQSNPLPLVISIIAIISLFIGIFTPVLSFRINSEGLLGMVMDSFGFLGLSEFKNISVTYSPISMMTGKPPKINAADAIGSTMQEYLNNELNQYYSVIKNTRTENLDPSNQVLKKSISTLQLIGTVLSLLAFLSAIFVGIKLISPNSDFSTTLVSFGSSLLLILLIAGLIFLKSLKIDLGDMGAYFGISSFKLSEILKTNPAFGYFSLSIGSILALIRAFMKQS